MSVIPTRQQTPQIVRAGAAAVPRPPVAAGAAAGMTGRDIFRIIRKRKWLIIFSLAGCTALSVVATLLWLAFAPLYTTAALMEVRPQMETALAARRGEYAQTIIDSIALTQARLIRSEKVLRAAIDDDKFERIRKTHWYSEDPYDALKRLHEEIDVAPIPNTKLIQISLMGINKRDLPEIVNAVAEAAETDSRDSANQSNRAMREQLRVRRVALASQRDRVRAEKAKLLADADVPNMLERTNVLSVRLQALVPQVQAMQTELGQAERNIEIIKEQIKNGQISSHPRILQVVEYDYSLRTLRATLLNLRTMLASAKLKLGLRHRMVVNLEGRVQSMEQEVNERERTLIAAQAAGLLAGAESTRALILQRLTELREQSAFVDRSIRDLQKTLSQYRQLEDEETGQDEKIDRIDDRMLDLSILLEGKEAPLIVRRRAPTPLEPEHPDWWIMVPSGIVLGLVVGFGLAFLLEFVDTSIKGPSDVMRRVDLPMLGMVPHLDDLEEEIADPRMAFRTHPNSLIGEAFRQIRTCLQFSGPASQRRTLLVTSPMSADGRTTVAMNLGASIARGGRKVLVVDANFRQPAIKKLLPSCPDAGLSSALVGQAQWRELALEVEPNLNVIAAGPMPPNPAELLGSEQMSNLIAEMVNDYDQVIFDGAPCLLVTDASALSTLVDGVILVVRAGANTYGIVQRSREMLSRIGAHVVGVVLNGVRAIAGGYLRKNYDAFYEYQVRPSLPRE